MKHQHNNTAVCRPPREISNEIVVFTAILFGLIVAGEANSDDSVIGPFLTGKSFRYEIEQPFSGSWTNIELRSILNEVASNRKISIILDRRLDPTAELPIDISNVPLRVGLIGVAKQAKGDGAVLENSIYLGPVPATKLLRTLIELRTLELLSKRSGISGKHRQGLLERRTIEWHDLDTPREILNHVTQLAGLKIRNPEVIPHDLWAAATLPSSNMPEVLTVILIQLDLTFRWSDGGSVIELDPIPDVVSLERKHSSKQKPADVIDLIHKRFPQMEVKIANTDVIVTGTLEEHEAIEELLQGGRANFSIKIISPKPIKDRIFLLKTERTPVSAVMKKLEESAISFEYDADQLKTNGIDLETAVDIDVKNASATEFFKALFDPIGLDFKIDHLTVTLKPKRQRE